MGNAIQMSLICADLNREHVDINNQPAGEDNKYPSIQSIIENNDITEKEQLDKWLDFVNAW